MHKYLILGIVLLACLALGATRVHEDGDEYIFEAGATVLQLPNGTSGTTDADGEVYVDTDGVDADYTKPVIQVYTGSATQYLFPIDAPIAADDGKFLSYDAATDEMLLEASTGTGDMLKSVYDSGDDGMVDEAEAIVINVRADVAGCDTGTANTCEVGELVGFAGTFNACSEVSYAEADEGTGVMPAAGIVVTEVSTSHCNGQILVSGVWDFGADVISAPTGSDLYVAITEGDITTTRPTGAGVGIQKIGVSIEESAGTSHDTIGLFGAGRSNDVPNLAEHNVWVGSATSVATPEAIPDCDAAGSALTYDETTHAIDCASDLATDAEASLCADHDGTDINCTGEVITVVDDQHTHGTISLAGIDISADTNLAVTAPIVLTDDTISVSGITATELAAGSLTAADAAADMATQAEIDLKAPLASPTFTGTVTVPTPFTLGATSVTSTGTELNLLDGVTDVAEANGDTFTGVHDFGGATSVEIPNGAAPTATTEGQIAMDNSDNGEADGQIVYDDGVGTRVLSDVHSFCATIENLAAADDDFPFWMNTAYTSVTLISAACHCIGTCTTEADLILENDDGTPAVMTGTITCEDTTTGDTNTDLSGAEATIDQYDVVRFDVNNAVSPETDKYTFCVNYRIVRQ